MDRTEQNSHHSEQQRIIFLNSFLPRTGHNFAAAVIQVFSNHEVLPHSRGEIKISTILEYYSKVREAYYYETPKKFLNSLFVDNLRDKIISHSNYQYVMLKDTSFTGVEQLPKMFPEDLHFILIRDPKNVYLSLLKGMNLKKHTLKNKIKRLGIPCGLYPYFYSRKLSIAILKTFPQLKVHTIIRYEDLVKKDEKTLLFLKTLFKTDKTLEQICTEIDAIQVINTSFYEETGAKSIWEMKPKTASFDPLKRKGFNNLVVKAVELGSRKLRKKLNYV